MAGKKNQKRKWQTVRISEPVRSAATSSAIATNTASNVDDISFISLSKYAALEDEQEVESATQKQPSQKKQKKRHQHEEDEPQQRQPQSLTYKSTKKKQVNKRTKIHELQTKPNEITTSADQSLQQEHQQQPTQKQQLPLSAVDESTIITTSFDNNGVSDNDTERETGDAKAASPAAVVPVPSLLSNFDATPHKLLRNVDGSYTVHLSVGEYICFYGSVDITIEYGYVEINRYVLSPQSAPSRYHLISPSWEPSALLSIRHHQPKSSILSSSALSISSRYNDESIIKLYSSTSPHRLYPDDEGRQENEYLPIDLPSFCPIVRQSANDITRVIYSPLSISSVWDDLLLSFHPSTITHNKQQSCYISPSVLFCGHRNTGKSTLLRLLLNTFLSYYKRVAVLDTDVGQTEFTPPTMVSLTLTDSPIFSPPYAHQRTPICSYFIGDTTITEDPAYYLHCIQLLYKYYQQHYSAKHTTEIIPLLINTPGWLKGVGLTVLRQMINIIQPTHIIQLTDNISPSSTNGSNNTDSLSLSLPHNKDCVYHQLPRYITPPSLTTTGRTPSSSSSSRLTAEKSRLLAYIGYFVQSTAPPISFTTISTIVASQPIYHIHFNDVYLYIQYQTNLSPHNVLYVFNAAIVALCIMPDDTLSSNTVHSSILDKYQLHLLHTRPSSSSSSSSDIQCIGLGIIRAVDIDHRYFYLSTPIKDRSLLQQVNLFIRSPSLELPNIFMYRHDYIGHQPYLPASALTSNSGVGAGTMKTRKNLQRKRLIKNIRTAATAEE